MEEVQKQKIKKILSVAVIALAVVVAVIYTVLQILAIQRLNIDSVVINGDDIDSSVVSVIPASNLIEEEFKGGLEDVSTIERDNKKIMLFAVMQAALNSYLLSDVDDIKFPDTLDELLAGGFVSDAYKSIYNEFDLFYIRCDRTIYHMGVNLKGERSVLAGDSDFLSACATGTIYGNDDSGCNNEPGMKCYDSYVEVEMP